MALSALREIKKEKARSGGKESVEMESLQFWTR